MIENDFLKHLQTTKSSIRVENVDNEYFKKVDYLYSKSTLYMKKILTNISSSQDIESVQECAKNMVDLISNECCTIESLVEIMEYDYYTHTHSINVGFYSVFFGKTLGLSQDDLLSLGTAALLHDLGKSKVDINILNKNGKLTDLEFISMKEHPKYGYNLAKLYGIKNRKILLGIRHHHERMDGSGYPDSLTIDEITLFPKIIAMCDVFDALTTKRSYKPSLNTFEAFNIMKREKNHFDSQLLNKFIKILVKK